MAGDAKQESAREVRVWDLPTRLFHWSLATLVVVSVVSGKIGSTALDWHFFSGYVLLTLLLFRLLWGVAGDRYARFAGFVRGPRAVLDDLNGRLPESAGHRPLAALSVLALLVSMLLQAVTGLFANDAIFSEGPLARLVSNATSDLLTSVHKRNQIVLFVLIGLHLVAVLFYESVRGRRLIRPMISGDRAGIDAEPARDDSQVRLRALILLAVAASLICYLVRL